LGNLFKIIAIKKKIDQIYPQKPKAGSAMTLPFLFIMTEGLGSRYLLFLETYQAAENFLYLDHIFIC
jgi:hypothetical protein